MGTNMRQEGRRRGTHEIVYIAKRKKNEKPATKMGHLDEQYICDSFPEDGAQMEVEEIEEPKKKSIISMQKYAEEILTRLQNETESEVDSDDDFIDTDEAENMLNKIKILQKAINKNSKKSKRSEFTS